jgi:hypothetical protein
MTHLLHNQNPKGDLLVISPFKSVLDDSIQKGLVLDRVIICMKCGKVHTIEIDIQIYIYIYVYACACLSYDLIRRS